MDQSLLLKVLVHLFLILGSSTLVTGRNCEGFIPKPLYVRLGNCSYPVNSDWYPDGVASVESWGLEIGLASPPQPLCLEPSTVVNNTIIMRTDVCTDDQRSGTINQCASRRGGLYNPKFSVADYNVSKPDTLAPDPGWTVFNPPEITNAANIKLQFASDILVPSYPIGLPQNASNSSVGQLGLGNNSTLLHHLIEAGLSTTNGFGFLAGSQSATNWRDGHLIPGGYDRGSLTGPFSTFLMNSSATVGRRPCPLHVTVDGLILTRPNQPDKLIISEGTLMPSCIEPLDNLFRFPEDTFGHFQDLTGWDNGTSISDDLYVIEPGLYYDLPFNGSLKFSLVGGLKVEVPNSELSWPVRGLDPMGKKVVQNNITVVNVFNTKAPEGTATLGKVFLSQLYLAVNYDLQQFMLAPIETNYNGVLDILPFNCTGNFDCPTEPNKWSIGVIVLAVILSLLILAFCIYVFRRQRNTRDPEERPETQEAIRNNNHLLPYGRIEADGGSVHVSDDNAITPITSAGTIPQRNHTGSSSNRHANGTSLVEMPSPTETHMRHRPDFGTQPPST